MATSGSTDFQTNKINMITGAYELCRVIDPGEALADSLVNSASNVLNRMLKFWQTFGLSLWAIKRGSIVLTQGTQSYTLGPAGTGFNERPLRLVEAFYRDGVNDTPLELISREEYWHLGDKSIEGIPNELYYDPQLTLGVLYVFNPADANIAGNTIELVYHRPFEDMDSNVDDFDFPVEWEEAIEFNLALRLAPRNGVPGRRISQLRLQARETLEEVRGWDTENVSTYIQPQFHR